MPIKQLPLSRTFTDDFGNTNPRYKANAGDKGTFTFQVTENIFIVSSASEPITSSSTLRAENKLRFPNLTSMLGFEVGQNVVLTKRVSSGATTTKTTTISDIDYTALTIQFASLLTPASANLDLYNDTTTMTVYSTDMRNQLVLSLGFSRSSQSNYSDRLVSPSNPEIFLSDRKSLIDGTLVQLSFDTSGMIVTDLENLVQTSTQSGHFEVSATIERLADVNAYTRQWEITITLIQIGALIQFPFNSSDSSFIKLYYDLSWLTIGNEEWATTTQWLDFSQTGWFNQPYLYDAFDSSVITMPTNPIYYNQAVTNTISFSSTSATIGLGALYVPSLDTYYKNKPNNQSELCMFLNSYGALAVGVYTSEIAPDGSFYEIEITALSYVANVHTVTFIFRYGNTEFIDFMESRAAIDRFFHIYFKVGNINHLIYLDNLVKAPKTIIDLTTKESTPALFKLDKTTDTYTASSGLICSIEDNAYLEQKFLMPKGTDYENAKYEIIVAEVGNLDNYFVLESYFFDLSQIGYINNGALATFTQSLPAGLNTGGDNFTNALLSRKGGPLDTPTDFGLFARLPFLINWRYWLEQNNAFIVFDENRNRNWINYQDGTYQIYVKTSIETASIIYTNHYEIAKIYDYDETHTDAGQEWNGTTSIEYFIDSTGEQVGALINGELMRVKVTVNNIYAATTTTAWGQMTIETFEATPRWNISTNYNADSNVNNPFQPLLGQTRLLHTVVSGTEQTFEALIDTDKISGINHKITLKFYNDVTPIEQVRSEFDTVLTDKSSLTTLDENECIDCCDNFVVFANDSSINPSPDPNFRYDLTTMYYLLSGGDLVRFKGDLNGVNVFDVAGTTFPNQSNAKYVQVDWDSAINNFGAGTYKLYIEYTPAFGSVVELLWGYFDLIHYTREQAEGYVNIKSYFNTNQSVQGINFTGVTLIDSINVQGFFGNRDPRMEIDNNIYNTRLQTKVVRENINEYTLTTNPITKAYTRKLLDLHLLNENDCYITDYNVFNHEEYVNKRVIVSAVESPEYFSLSKYSKIIAKFEDKIKNSRSFY